MVKVRRTGTASITHTMQVERLLNFWMKRWLSLGFPSSSEGSDNSFQYESHAEMADNNPSVSHYGSVT
jgi:hypothetical protein